MEIPAQKGKKTSRAPASACAYQAKAATRQTWSAAVLAAVRDVEHHAVEPVDVRGAVSGDLGRVCPTGKLLGEPEPREHIGPSAARGACG